MSTELIETIAGLRERLAPLRRSGATIGLVPTMGALHEGHGTLIEQCARECAATVVSVFVNPIQFNQAEDFEKYPRTLAADLAFCEARGATFVFAPSNTEMYPGALRTSVDVSVLTDHLCGRFRPGHFKGVATVVTKLFQIVQPDAAYFGEKDAQQLAVIRRMVRDLNMNLRIVGVPTVRESDGLAMSSRNRHLCPEERHVAPLLYQALLAAGRAIASGATDPAEVRGAALALLAREPLFKVEYLEVVDPEEMQPVRQIAGPVRLAAAVWLGSTRLIDNLLCGAE
jgi:pantoate--beta-alanine ligase